MKKLLDLRFVIGLFFLLVGGLLLVYYLLNTDITQTSLNLKCGSVFVVFGMSMVALSYFSKIEEE
ncbi:MAG: hypothetical protein KGO81_04115 [Bacteroidota bacterium]|nr:hypothetical protein [Bacteroidota bacterium]